MATLALPSILRRTPPEQNQSAEVSPDAPPDQPPLIAALNRGQSATAGSGDGAGGDLAAIGEEGDVPPGPDRYCPYGVGKPRRQSFSVYSVGCAPAFHGNNGGRTAPGVSPTEIRVVFYFAPDGDLEDETRGNDTRVARDYSRWVNSRYQLYGRRIHLYGSAHGLDAASGEAAAARAKAYDAFAGFDMFTGNPTVTDASVRQKLITFTLFRPNSFYRNADPYGWSYGASTDRQIDIASEVVCKQLKGSPPEYNERKDLAFDYSKPRVFGAVIAEPGGGTANEQLLRAALKRCGVELKVVVPYNPQTDTANPGTAMTQMKAQGVTTIVDLVGHVETTVMANAATGQQYFPEWFALTSDLLANNFAQGIPTEQWRHAFGVTLGETPRPLQTREWYQAVKEVDPDYDNPTTDDVTYQGFFYALVNLANGIQLAGPNLTPQTFAAAMHKIPARRPVPLWSVGGSFQSPDPWSFNKYAALVWWDPNATDPVLGDQGAYRYLYDAKRFATGQIPSEKVPFFSGGGVLQTPDS
jgi:hypothetical protein